jgi:hypothetical protein
LPVRHRRRAGGTSKVAGSLRGTVKATWQLTVTMVRIASGMRSKKEADDTKGKLNRRAKV